MALPVVVLLLLLVHGSAVASASSLRTGPAFVWSDHRSFGLESRGAVDYRVFSPHSLTETLMQKFGWSSSLCSRNEDEEKVDTILVFIGNQLHSEDVSHNSGDAFDVLAILKDSFSSSKYSMALPYISIERPGIAMSLLSSIKGRCDVKSRPGKILFVGPCLRQELDSRWDDLTEGIDFAESAKDAKEFIYSRKSSRLHSETDVIVTCPSSHHKREDAQSEGDTLAMLLSALRGSGTSNAVLYASHPYEAGGTTTFQGRLLASNVSSSSNSTCDDICEVVVGVYEGVIVAVTLLIILISGLCCMMGIDTPTRFESAQDS